MTVKPLEERCSDDRIRRSSARVLRENVLCSMSTVAPGNRPHINTAYFAYTPELMVYFLSDPSSRHCRNLKRNPSLAMTIFRSAQEWGGEDRGLHLFGICRQTRGGGARRGRATRPGLGAKPRRVRSRGGAKRHQLGGARLRRNRMSPLLITEKDVEGLLRMEDALGAVEDGLRALGRGEATNRPRQRVGT